MKGKKTVEKNNKTGRWDFANEFFEQSNNKCIEIKIWSRNLDNYRKPLKWIGAIVKDDVKWIRNELNTKETNKLILEIREIESII